MPLDIKLFREDQGGDPEKIRESQRRRFASVELVDEIIALDTRWRSLTGEIDNLKKNRNTVQKAVGAKMKAKEPCEEMVAEIKTMGEAIEAKEREQEDTKATVDSLVGKVGNIVEGSVHVSNNEDENVVIRTWGTPRDPSGLLNHHDLLWRIGGYEPERGVAVAGHRGYFLRDAGVLLNQAFINYGIAFLRARSYSILQPPFFMRKSMMAGVAQLEQFDEELYKVTGDGEDKYLIATSEQPICGFHAGEWLAEKELPLRYSGISSCFRKEAGAHGKDTWGIFRVHQFEKVEQFVICEGDLEKSNALQEEMIRTAEEFWQSLGFPYQVISIVSGALNNAAIRKYDLEAWFPGYNSYRELVSCSNCTDYQSRAMEIRCGNKKMGSTDKKYVHMLNSTLCATGRGICCLLENCQTAEGVNIPEVLVPFMGGITFLPFVRDSRLPEKGGASSSTSSSSSSSGEKEKKEKVATDAANKPAKATASAAAETAAPVPPPAEKLSPEAEAVVAEILKTGDQIRVLKISKASSEEVQPLIDGLLQLKEKYKSVTGKVYGKEGGSGADSSGKEKKEKKEKPAAAGGKAVASSSEPKAPEKKVFAGPPAVPIIAPSYTSPAPLPRSSPSASSSLDVNEEGAKFIPASDLGLSVWTDKAGGGVSVDLQVLEVILAEYSYVSGYVPTKEDDRVLHSLAAPTLGDSPDQTALKAWSSTESFGVDSPNTTRWIRNVVSYLPSERAGWK